jgi:hypothetical protein
VHAPKIKVLKAVIYVEKMIVAAAGKVPSAATQGS